MTTNNDLEAWIGRRMIAASQPIPASKLTFVISSDDIAALAAATQTLSLVQYDRPGSAV
jgi:hypothetical protein